MGNVSETMMEVVEQNGGEATRQGSRESLCLAVLCPCVTKTLKETSEREQRTAATWWGGRYNIYYTEI